MNIHVLYTIGWLLISRKPYNISSSYCCIGLWFAWNHLFSFFNLPTYYAIFKKCKYNSNYNYFIDICPTLRVYLMVCLTIKRLSRITSDSPSHITNAHKVFFCSLETSHKHLKRETSFAYMRKLNWRKQNKILVLIKSTRQGRFG